METLYAPTDHRAIRYTVSHDHRGDLHAFVHHRDEHPAELAHRIRIMDTDSHIHGRRFNWLWSLTPEALSDLATMRTAEIVALYRAQTL